MKIKLLDENKNYLGEYKYSEAILLSKEKNLDLIKVNNNVYMFGNIKKYSFDIRKRRRIKKKKDKILKFNSNISNQDIFIKIRKIIEFIKKKYIIKIMYINRAYKINSEYSTRFFKKLLVNLRDYNFNKNIQIINNIYTMFIIPK